MKEKWCDAILDLFQLTFHILLVLLWRDLFFGDQLHKIDFENALRLKNVTNGPPVGRPWSNMLQVYGCNMCCSDLTKLSCLVIGTHRLSFCWIFEFIAIIFADEGEVWKGVQNM